MFCVFNETYGFYICIVSIDNGVINHIIKNNINYNYK